MEETGPTDLVPSLRIPETVFRVSTVTFLLSDPELELVASCSWKLAYFTSDVSTSEEATNTIAFLGLCAPLLFETGSASNVNEVAFTSFINGIPHFVRTPSPGEENSRS